jgi:hypothetical protein
MIGLLVIVHAVDYDAPGLRYDLPHRLVDAGWIGHVQATHQHVVASGQVSGGRDVSHCGDNIPALVGEQLGGCMAESRR